MDRSQPAPPKLRAARWHMANQASPPLNDMSASYLCGRHILRSRLAGRNSSVRPCLRTVTLVLGPEYNSNPDRPLLEEIWSWHGYAPQNRPWADLYRCLYSRRV